MTMKSEEILKKYLAEGNITGIYHVASGAIMALQNAEAETRKSKIRITELERDIQAIESVSDFNSDAVKALRNTVKVLRELLIEAWEEVDDENRNNF